jgi:oligosaccharide repeat unit polymerase
MLDSITSQLQNAITAYRRSIAQASLQEIQKEINQAKQQYSHTQHAFDVFVDTHGKQHSYEVEQERKALENEVFLAYNHLQEVSQQYARQKALTQRSYCSFAVVKSNTLPQENNDYLIGYLLSFIIISLLVTHGFILYKRGRKEKISFTDWGDIFSPWSVSILIWLGVLGFYYLLNTDLYPITRQFYYCLIIWLPIFCICSYLTYYLQPQKNSASIQQKNIYSNQYIFNFFFIVSLIITPLYVYKILQIVLTFSSEDLMNNIRTLAVHGEGVGFLSYSNVINQSLFVVAIWSHPKVPMWKVITLALACILNSLAIMEKGTIFFVFICIMFVLFEKKKIKLESIAMAGILLLAFFYFFNLARSGEDSDYQKNETLLDFFAMYALSPPVAFCQLLPEVTQQFGTNTFESIYLFLRRYGADVVVKEKLQEFVFVPIPTNVYTMFQPFFIDFGYKGIAFFAAIYGTMSGYFYRLFRNANGFGKCIYTYIVNVLILQFYQENIFLSLVFVLQFTFFVYILTQERITISFHQQPIKHAPEHE